ncbi:MAG: formate dehydrogenase accessory sulfurtransferase FdhD [Pseudomonadota bacterium]
MQSSSATIEIHRRREGAREAVSDAVALEEPLEIRLAYSTPEGRALRSLSITMRTPGQDHDLAAGFLLSESIVTKPDDIVAIETCGTPAPETGLRNAVRVELDASVAVDLTRLERHFYSTSSCGVCGKASLDALRAVGIQTLSAPGPLIREDVLTRLPAALRERQATFDTTGGLHAAGMFDMAGNVLDVAEDVGRHNAVDKLIGSRFRAGELPAGEYGLIVSGRASFELVQKALVAGMPMLAAVSAPSSLAVDLAREFGMTLIGFLRGDTFNIYSRPERVIA